MNIVLFLAEVKAERLLFKNDAALRKMLAAFEGTQVEVLIRTKSSDKYAALDAGLKKVFRDFMSDFDKEEAAAMLSWSGSGYDSLDIIRQMAQFRFDRGRAVPKEIVAFFCLGREPMLFGDQTSSNKSISEAVSE